MRAAGIQHSRDNVQFAESVNRDRVSVEVWRGDKRVAQDEINVTLNEERLRWKQSACAAPNRDYQRAAL